MNVVIDKVRNVKGEVSISGSKNAALPIIISCLLIKGTIKLTRIPNIIDIQNVINILKKLNVEVEYYNNELVINNKMKFKKNDLLIKEMELLRGTSYFWGVLLHYKRKLKSYIPGGCKIGNRPFDLHFDFFKKLGIDSQIKNNILYFKKTKKKSIDEIIFKKESMGATINLILYTVLGKQQLVIQNPSLEPEVLDLINFLNKAGALITVKNKQIRITGVKRLNPIEYEIMFDRIEAGSYMLLAACFDDSELLIKNVDTSYMNSVIEVIDKLGCLVETKGKDLLIRKTRKLNYTDVTISTYPAFPTDLQQILTIALLSSGGKIKDLIFPDRIAHIKELKKVGAMIEFKNGTIEIMPSTLIDNVMDGIDLRGTFGLIVAAGMIDGKTVISNVDNVLRGYEKLEEKLVGINFPIKFIK